MLKSTKHWNRHDGLAALFLQLCNDIIKICVKVLLSVHSLDQLHGKFRAGSGISMCILHLQIDNISRSEHGRTSVGDKILDDSPKDAVLECNNDIEAITSVPPLLGGSLDLGVTVKHGEDAVAGIEGGVTLLKLGAHLLIGEVEGEDDGGGDSATGEFDGAACAVGADGIAAEGELAMGLHAPVLVGGADAADAEPTATHCAMVGEENGGFDSCWGNKRLCSENHFVMTQCGRRREEEGRC